MINIERGLQWGIEIANDDRHGYSQINRYGVDYDCSSFVSMILVFSGALMPVTCTTFNILPYLKNNGYSIVKDRTRKRGDIFLNVNHHIIICVDESNILHASGVKKGILIEPFYTPSFGYDYHLGLDTDNKTIYEIALEVIAGKWGNYPERKTLLEQAGYNYDFVQREVDSILNNYVG